MPTKFGTLRTDDINKTASDADWEEPSKYPDLPEAPPRVPRKARSKKPQAALSPMQERANRIARERGTEVPYK